MKENLKKVKEGLFLAFVMVVAVVIAGAVALSTQSEEDYNNIVMAGGVAITFENPLKDCEVIKDYSEQKLQFNSTLKQWEAHKAVDLKADVGTEVFAVAEGKVTAIETTHLLGTTITIEHAKGFVSRYSSLNSQTEVKVGDKVKLGEKLGTVDATAKGESEQGSHLHFELGQNDKKVDPNLYFTFGQK